MDKKVLVLDLDGTLTNSEKKITPETKAALMEMQEKGHTVVLASGRPTAGITPLAKELKLKEHGGYILSFNGGKITDLFVRDDKKRNYYLITVRGDKRVDLKKFREEHGTRPLSFASENDLMNLLGLIPGAVTPLGILNDSERKVKFFLDEELVNGGLIGVHPNDNTATVWLKTTDLIDIVTEHGNEVEAVRI